MNWSKSGVVLVVLLLVLAALIVRHLDLPAYSQEEVRQELSALCGEYAALSKRRAAEAEWQSFDQRAREIMQPIVADLEDPRYPSPLYQMARYDLPKAIASRGKIPDSSLQQQLRAHDELVAEMETAPQRRRDAQRRAGRYSDTPEGAGSVDLLFVGAMIFDGVLLIAIGYMLFWPARKHLFLPKDAQSMLRQLDKRIERNPDSVRYLAIRARLLADAGRPEEAIADIDRILKLKTHGVDLEQWHQMREELSQKVSETH